MHQPLEYVDVAMHADVYVVAAVAAVDVGSEVGHLRNQHVLAAHKVCGRSFGVWGLGFGVWGLGFGVWGLRFEVDLFQRDASRPRRE